MNDDADRRHGFAALLHAEVDNILDNAAFRRSPVLAKLLRYLAEQTVEGKADSLKSYTVAVDALGRPADIDPNTDSSARVQMVRLRKALAAHYAEHGPVDDVCIYLQQGCYKLRLGSLASAYPNLYRPLSGDRKPVAAEEATPSAAAPASTGAVRRLPAVAIGLLILALAGAVAAFAILNPFSGRKPVVLSPILELSPIDHDRLPETAQVATLVDSALSDDLPRFRISRVRILRNGSKPLAPDAQEEVFRLSGRLARSGAANRTLFLTLEDARTSTAIWSKQYEFSLDKAVSPDMLSPLASEINGPFGVIAAFERRRLRDSMQGGYPCLLRYFDFMATRRRSLESELDTCFAQPVEEEGMKATLLAAQAMFAIERSSARDDFPAAAGKAAGLATQAVAADPLDGSANYVLARLSYVRRDCVAARYYTARAFELNPASPVIASNLAALAPLCGYRNAAALLDRALNTQSPRYHNNRLLLALAAISQGQPQRVSEIADSPPPETAYNRANFLLAEALIAAVNGDRAESRRYWQRYAALVPEQDRSPDTLLKRVMVIPDARRRLIAYLEAAGTFEG
jgi:Flp pilus assembly protein TadD